MDICLPKSPIETLEQMCETKMHQKNINSPCSIVFIVNFQHIQLLVFKISEVHCFTTTALPRRQSLHTPKLQKKKSFFFDKKKVLKRYFTN